jgi:glutamate dehydrogenase/leucine dehydrogenase
MDLLQQYKDKKPEIVFEWNDATTGAEGWVVINSLRGGAAGGGTRMKKGCTKDEVLSLAKTMEIKFSVAGPAIGGAKSGINFDPFDPRKQEVLERWYAAVMPLLKNYYGTGGDLNVPIEDIFPITEKHGLMHTQEGIVQGHFKPTASQKKKQVDQLRKGVSLPMKTKSLIPSGDQAYNVADLITGYGVAEGVRHFYDIYKNTNIKGKRVIIQGFGNVAGAAAFYLASQGAVIVGIIDRAGGIITDKGLNAKDISDLMNTRNGNALNSPYMVPFEEVNEKIWSLKADIMIPGAASKIIDKNQFDAMVVAGVEVMSCGANVPFKEEDVFYGDLAKYADERMSIVPDFIANCGMARVFAYLMHPGVKITDKAIFDDVSNIVKNALIECKTKNPDSKNLQRTALEIAIGKIM